MPSGTRTKMESMGPCRNVYSGPRKGPVPIISYIVLVLFPVLAPVPFLRSVNKP